jgi:hypothetical protein
MAPLERAAPTRATAKGQEGGPSTGSCPGARNPLRPTGRGLLMEKAEVVYVTQELNTKSMTYWTQTL